MTHICYTLEEASEKLKLSETVLVRLSQYFKVPKAAYEDVGYLSFKGDLAFTEQDIAFFRQAKERLLAGENLDDIKRRIRTDQPQAQWQEESPAEQQAVPLQGGTVSVYSPEPMPSQQRYPHQSAGVPSLGVSPQSAKGQNPIGRSMEELSPMREIQDRKPYEKAAERSFERYKSLHRSGLGKVFENMLKEVGSVATRGRDETVLSGFRPFRTKRSGLGEVQSKKPTGSSGQEGTSRPFGQRHPAGEFQSQQAKISGGSHSSGNESWEQIIQQAASHPRRLNTQLKNAAVLLRERALQESPLPENRLR